MKKLALILALMLVPCTAFGLEMLNDTAMDQISGQSGVSIAFDDVQIFIDIERLAWVDCDGFEGDSPASLNSTCNGSGAMVSLNNFQIDVLNVNAIVATNGAGTGSNPNLISTSCGNIPLFYDYSDTSPLGGCISWTTGHTNGLDNLTGAFFAQALTIDVTDELPALTEGLNHNSTFNSAFKVAGVLIGLPTMEIHIQEMFLDITIDDLNNETLVANNGDSFGQILMEGVTFSILSGWMEIAPHHN
jgi:hypothetical protein